MERKAKKLQTLNPGLAKPKNAWTRLRKRDNSSYPIRQFLRPTKAAKLTKQSKYKLTRYAKLGEKASGLLDQQ